MDERLLGGQWDLNSHARLLLASHSVLSCEVCQIHRAPASLLPRCMWQASAGTSRGGWARLGSGRGAFASQLRRTVVADQEVET